MKTAPKAASTERTTVRAVPADMIDNGRVAIGNVQSPFKAQTSR